MVVLRLLPLVLHVLRVQPSSGVEPDQAGLDAALKFTLDLQSLIGTQQQDALIDALLLPRRTAGADPLRQQEEDGFRAAMIGLARRHGGAASPAAAAEVITLLERGPAAAALQPSRGTSTPATPLAAPAVRDDSPIDAEFAAALREGDLERMKTLLRGTRSLAAAGALAVGGEPALALVLRREAERPILSRSA
jgi:hypothetical protein